MNIKLAINEQQITSSYREMVQLRPHLSQLEFTRQLLLQQQAGYQLLLAVDNSNEVRAVAGFVVTHKLA